MKIHGEQYEVETIVEAIPGATDAIRGGGWPGEYFGMLLVPVAAWSDDHPTRYHHTGYTYPNREAFDTATKAAGGSELIASDLSTPQALHHRRYSRAPSREGGPDSFREHHLVGSEGDGLTGIHFDFITDDPTSMLKLVMEELGVDESADKPSGIRVVTRSFGGGDAPVGKIGLQPVDDPALEVGVMARTHWSDPADW